MNVFPALLVNAYRELNARKLFWLTLALSAIVVLLYMSLGFTEDGVFLLFGLFDIESQMFARGSGLDEILYRSIFSDFIVGIWLGWAVIILALVSTSSIFPDAMADGTIDLTLSKPIRRITFFLFKYFTGLLFVFLQVALFCVGVFLAMGWRIGEWNWIIFAAVPILTLVFSYLFAINVLIGVWTRSALAALLLTILLWFIIFILFTAGNIVGSIHHTAVLQIEQAQEMVDAQQQHLDAAPAEEDHPLRNTQRQQLADAQTELAEARDMLDTIDRWHRPARIIQTILPKTGESAALVSRWLTREDDVSLTDVMYGNVHRGPDGEWVVRDRSNDEEVAIRMEQEMRERSLWYVIGTSLIFEVVIVALAAWRFCRRDF